MNFKITENYKIGKIVTFIPNKALPVYNWFYYKEGFSRQFVEYAYKRLNISEDDVILDPFVGCGTSALYAKEMGNLFYGLDVNDVAILAANVKTYDYDISILKNYAKKILKKPTEHEIKEAEKEIERITLSIVKKAYPSPVLKQILAYKHKILNKIEEKKYQEFFILGLMKTSTITTYARKEGGSIKIDKKRKFPPVKVAFKNIIKKMLSDLQKINFKIDENKIIIIKGDARELSRYVKDKIDVIITSPPYLNKIEYTNVYALEQYLFISKRISRPAVRSYIGEIIEEEEDVFYGKYPMNNISRAYFRDMYQVIKEIKKISSNKMRGALVIGDGCFPNGVVKSDILISELLEREGFAVEEIERVNVRWCMRNRISKVGPMHESIVWFRK